MKREGYLATLSVITTLLLGELDDTGTAFALTDPLWIGVMTHVFYNTGYYCILASVVTSVVTSLSALVTRTPSRVLVPTLLASVGLSSFLVEIAIVDASKWFNIERTDPEWGSVPEHVRLPHYLASVVPFGIFVLGMVPLSYSVWAEHLRKRREFDARGVDFEDATRRGLAIEVGPQARGGGSVESARLLPALALSRPLSRPPSRLPPRLPLPLSHV